MIISLERKKRSQHRRLQSFYTTGVYDKRKVRDQKPLQEKKLRRGEVHLLLLSQQTIARRKSPVRYGDGKWAAGDRLLN